VPFGREAVLSSPVHWRQREVLGKFSPVIDWCLNYADRLKSHPVREQDAGTFSIYNNAAMKIPSGADLELLCDNAATLIQAHSLTNMPARPMPVPVSISLKCQDARK
jgi:hypothetical protein